ncbi:MAG: hypothetical protein U0791_14000 [Gemmataceae bacterium]
MRNLLALVGAVVVGFAVIGWYLGWYQLGISKTADGNLQVETNVNTKKVVDDSGAFFKKAGEAVGSHLERPAQDAQAAPANTPAPQDKQKVTLFGFDLSQVQKK